MAVINIYKTSLNFENTNISEGLADDPKSVDMAPSAEQISTWRKSSIRKRVAIVGGGVAGMGALKTFLENGFDDVILLEAQDRLGGRVATYREGSFYVEDGAEWIHGEEGNILYQIAKEAEELQEPFPEQNYENHIVREDGSSDIADWNALQEVEILIDNLMKNNNINGYINSYGEYIAKRFDNEIARGEPSDVRNAWRHYLEQRIMADEGTESDSIATNDADGWIHYGNDRKWKNGFEKLLKYLSKSIPASTYRLNSPVKHIFWSLNEAAEVLLVLNGGDSFLVDHAIVAVSVEYLKRHQNTLFNPPISDPLKTSLQGISLGGANKIFIGWDMPWWGRHWLCINILWRKFDLPSTQDWLYGVFQIYSNEEHRNILQFFISGEHSRKTETMEDIKLQMDLLYLLKRLLRRESIPLPTFFRRTRWNSNEWSCGSYSSFITVEGSKRGISSRAPFRVPLYNGQKPVIHWSGEHTHDKRYGTVDGALHSGIRESKAILNYYGDVKQHDLSSKQLPLLF